MKEAANRNIEFSEEELDNVVKSLTSLSPLNNTIDWESVRRLFSTSAHLSHKDWHRTQGITQDLYNLINGPEDAVFRQIFARVLEDGNWDGATAAAAARPSSFEPWVVLVTGVNGIRKTSSVYQPWFKSALAQALAGEFNGSDDELPDGRDSFFRQLDYIVATVANEDFRALYALGDGELARYAALKDATFARHRTVAEAVGALLVAAAQRRRLNVMIETSGRDPAMFRYVDALFPAASGYRRLAVNFAVSDIAFAERSVDDRMRRELRDGRAAHTTWRVLERLPLATHVEAQIHTGRTHQIRVHLLHLGFPVVGDTTYGAKQNKKLQEQTNYAAPRVLLHAKELTFIHPRTKKEKHFTAPLPKDFKAALKSLR